MKTAREIAARHFFGDEHYQDFIDKVDTEHTMQIRYGRLIDAIRQAQQEAYKQGVDDVRAYAVKVGLQGYNSKDNTMWSDDKNAGYRLGAYDVYWAVSNRDFKMPEGK